MLNVWYIYLHLTLKLPKCREIGHTLSIWEWLFHPVGNYGCKAIREAQQLGLQPLVYVRGFASAGVDPKIMGISA